MTGALHIAINTPKAASVETQLQNTTWHTVVHSIRALRLKTFHQPIQFDVSCNGARDAKKSIEDGPV